MTTRTTLVATLLLGSALLAVAPVGEARGGCVVGHNADCSGVVCLSGGGDYGPYRDCVPPPACTFQPCCVGPDGAPLYCDDP